LAATADEFGQVPAGIRGTRAWAVILGNMMIRDATLTDWSAIWLFLREIVAAGETYTWPRDVTEERARDMWLVRPPSRTVVAVDQDGTVLGPAN